MCSTLDVEREEGDRVMLSGPDFALTGVRKQPLGGGRAAVAIRPEEISMGDAPGGVNTIVAARRQRRIRRARLAARRRDAVGNGAARARHRSRIALGDTVRVHVPVERALVYPGE